MSASLATRSGGPAQADYPPQRIEGVAAVVGGHAPGPEVDVLLRSDVELRARLHLVEAGKLNAVPSRSLLRASLRELIGELLLAREASRVRVGTLSAADIVRERRHIAESFGGEAPMRLWLAQHDVTEREIEVMAERRAQVGLFLSANLEGDEVTQTAVDSALAAEGTSVDRVDEVDPLMVERREVVRRQLVRRALQRAVEHWVQVLRARTVVRVFARFRESP